MSELYRIDENDTSGYVGVDHEYRNYANETDRPILDDEQKRVIEEHGLLTDDEAVAQGLGDWAPPSGKATESTAVEPEGDDEDDDDDETPEGDDNEGKEKGSESGLFSPTL